jgi:O-6-methylguanine DNA methyltransferase
VEHALRYTILETPVGPLYVAYSPTGVCYATSRRNAAAFEAECEAEVGARPVRDPRPPAALARRIRDHLEGRRRFDGPFDLAGLTGFQQEVLAKLCEIPRGEVRPYGWVAREIGAPDAVRAVGSACARNPVAFLIPCHRVVRTDGRIGNYSAGGPAMKRRILAHEGADVARLAALAGRGIRFRGSRSTKLFCLPTCHAMRHRPLEDAVFFGSPAEARARGYRPCQRCRPA